MDLNKAMIIGRLTRDPEIRTTPSGQSVTSFSVATGYAWKDKQTGEKKEQTEFHNVVAWGRLGEVIAQYMRKGRQIYIEGRLQTRSWDGQDGVKRYRTEIIADNIIMLGDKGGAGGATGAPSSSDYSAPSESRGPSPARTAGPTDTEEISVEDIPF